MDRTSALARARIHGACENSHQDAALRSGGKVEERRRTTGSITSLQRASDLALEDPLESEGQQDRVGGRIFALDERDRLVMEDYSPVPSMYVI
ncbi:hypothetical protein K523DRAFT_322669 [Schizophyllum commune Tattone D]|nr:hypothetical protein K523DRAFT_322669 [Schizophyllum commune Tattone D]